MEDLQIRYVDEAPYGAFIPKKKPYGLYHARETRIDILAASFFEGCTYTTGGIAFIVGVNLDLVPSTSLINKLMTGSLGGIFGLVTGMPIGLLGFPISNSIVNMIEKKYPDFSDNYSEYIEHYIKNGEISEKLPLHYKEGIKIDAIPYFVNSIKMHMVEEIILDTRDKSHISIWDMPIHTYQDFAYSQLKETLMEIGDIREPITQLFRYNTQLSMGKLKSIGEDIVDFFDKNNREKEAKLIRELINP